MTLHSKYNNAPAIRLGNAYNGIKNHNQRDLGTATGSLDPLFHEIFSLSDIVAADMIKHHPLWSMSGKQSTWAQNLVDVSRAADYKRATTSTATTCIPTNGNSSSCIDLTFYKNNTMEFQNETTFANDRTLDHFCITFAITLKKVTSSTFKGFN